MNAARHDMLWAWAAFEEFFEMEEPRFDSEGGRQASCRRPMEILEPDRTRSIEFDENVGASSCGMMDAPPRPFEYM